jgi:hypothetical protein
MVCIIIMSAAEIKYLGTTLTDQNSIQEEIKNSLKSGKACYHSVKDLLFSGLLCKNIRINTYIKNFNFDCCFVWV